MLASTAGHEGARRAFGHHAAFRDDGEAVTAFGLVHVMSGYQDRRAAFGELEQPLPEIAPALRIDRAGRFIEQQQFGRVQRGRGQRQALLLSAAHGPGALRTQLLEIVGSALLGDARFHVPFQPVQIGHEAQVLVGGEVFPQREFLRHVAQPAPDGFGILDDGKAKHFGVTVTGQQHAAEHAQRGRLAGAVRAEKSVNTSGGDVEVDVIHRDLVTEFSRELPRAYCRLARCHSRRRQLQRDVDRHARGQRRASFSSITTSARNERRERSAAVSE